MHPSYFVKSTPEKPALLMADSGETVSYKQLEDRSNQAAQMFRARGLKAGDHIAILVENQIRFFEICWAAQRSGIIFTALSTRLGAEEAAYIITDCGAKMLVTSMAMAVLAEQVLGQTPAVQDRLMIGGTIAGHESWESAIAGHSTERIADECAGGDMLYSSGTTGRPKGVFAPQESTEIDATNGLTELCKKVYGISPDTIYLSPAPLYHAAPLRFCMRVMALGGTVIVMEHFDAERYLELVQQHNVTHTQLVPTMFVRMLKLAPEIRTQYDVSSLRCAIHAAAPCPVPIKEQMIDWWGPIIWEYYAGTEGNGITLVGSSDWLTHKGTVGRAVIGVLKIADEDGNEMPPGEPGTVYFADGKPFSYHNDPKKTAESRNAKGWTTLGDVGYVDSDGFLYLTDRKAYMIISGGVNIYPQEAENILITHPKVADVAVFGVPNEEFGEEVKAVVQPRDMQDAGPELAAELMAFCRSHLSHLKCPRSVDFEEELPRHPTGKLYKRLLKDRYWAGHTSRIV
jgi:long-chain acyl-CoA synthetase